jgi:hypothetical protein
MVNGLTAKLKGNSFAIKLALHYAEYPSQLHYVQVGWRLAGPNQILPTVTILAFSFKSPSGGP